MYFFYGERKFQVLHTRLRLGCSSLNADLFHNHVSESDRCRCGEPETAKHYFFICIMYRNIRTETISNLAYNINIVVLLKGCPLYGDEANIEIFRVVHEFIKKSNRFTWNYASGTVWKWSFILIKELCLEVICHELRALLTIV